MVKKWPALTNTDGVPPLLGKSSGDTPTRARAPCSKTNAAPFWNRRPIKIGWRAKPEWQQRQQAPTCWKINEGPEGRFPRKRAYSTNNTQATLYVSR